MRSRIVKGGSALIELTGLRDEAANAWVNTASVTATLSDANGVAIAGAVGLTLPYVTASNGVYRTTLAASVTNGLTVGQQVRIRAVAITSGGSEMPFTLWAVVVESGGA